jgi:hypothetical protein
MRRGGCFVGCNARFHLLLPAQVEVKLHLFLQLARYSIPVSQRTDAP